MNSTVSVIKSVGVSAEELEKINAFTRRDLSEDEVYVFRMVLCDNEIDRDFEHFTLKSLEELANLFVGKTGIFDHNPKAGNQTARIFDTEVVRDASRHTALGEEYTYLQAKAYMLRNERTESLIQEIDGGIKKEISVGCSVKSRVCSICGEEMGACEHRAGARYDGKLCCYSLEDVCDAYEFSFVAVPAQRGAGVIKAFSPDEVVKALAQSEGEVTLTKSQIGDILSEISRLEKAAKAGKAYEDELRREVMSRIFLSHPDIPRKVLSQMLAPLDIAALSSLKKGFSNGNDTIAQLQRQNTPKNGDNGEFVI